MYNNFHLDNNSILPVNLFAKFKRFSGVPRSTKFKEPNLTLIQLQDKNTLLFSLESFMFVKFSANRPSLFLRLLNTFSETKYGIDKSVNSPSKAHTSMTTMYMKSIIITVFSATHSIRTRIDTLADTSKVAVIM